MGAKVLMTQAEYRKKVFQYFKKNNVTLSPKIQTWYTPEEWVKETSNIKQEYARKSNGVWLDSGMIISGPSYFVGTERVGFLLNGHLRRKALWNYFGKTVEEDGHKICIFPIKECLMEAQMITYFREVLIADEAQLKDPLRGQ